MKTFVFVAAALVTLMAVAVAPVEAAHFGELPTTFNDQGSQAPAFPGGR